MAVTDLKGTKVPPPIVSHYAYMVRQPGDLFCPNGLIFEELEREIRRFHWLHLVPETAQRAEPFLVIQGEPGIGKTVAATDASLRAGMAVAVLPVAMLASEHEGGATAVLNGFLEDMVRYSYQHRLRVTVVADDFDLSICANDGKTGKTINSNLLTQRLQAISDGRPYRNFDGSVISLIFTGNDFTQLRGSLLRDSRATWYTHTASHDDKLQIALHVLKPRNERERKFILQLARRYRAEAVAFWQSLHNDLLKARIDTMIYETGSDVEAIRRRLAIRQPLDFNQLKQLARARAAHRPRRFLR